MVFFLGGNGWLLPYAGKWERRAVRWPEDGAAHLSLTRGQWLTQGTEGVATLPDSSKRLFCSWEHLGSQYNSRKWGCSCGTVLGCV